MITPICMSSIESENIYNITFHIVSVRRVNGTDINRESTISFCSPTESGNLESSRSNRYFFSLPEFILKPKKEYYLNHS